MALIKLEDIATDGAVRQGDVVTDATGDDAYFVGPDEELTELCANFQDTVLEHDQEVAIGTIKCRVWIHGLASGEYKHPQACFHCGVSSTGDKMQRVDPVNCFVHIEGVPAQLVGNLMEFLAFGVCIVGC